MAEYNIPFNRPHTTGKELSHIADVIQNGPLSTPGRFTHLCVQWLEETLQGSKVLLTHSCTAALEMSALLCDIEPGDEVILPSYTFVSTANAFVLRGAHLKFVDIRLDTLNIDEQKIEAAITPRTKAIIPVHYAGIPAEMDAIIAIAQQYDVWVIEDAAQAIGATYKGRLAGTIGQLGCYSFHSTKNIGCGAGGALAINTERLSSRAELLVERGTNRAQFLRGQVDQYVWIDVGSSYAASELAAAFLYAQLEQAPAIMHTRRAIYNRYAQAFARCEKQGLIHLPARSTTTEHNGHMFYLILPTAESRADFMNSLAGDGIEVTSHYVPLHLSPMGMQMGFQPGDLPVTEAVSARIVRLPCYPDLTQDEQDYVISRAERFLQEHL